MPRQPWIDVVLALARLQVQLGRQPPGDDEREPLVGALRAEPGADRLQPVDHPGTVGLPRTGHDVGRRVVAASRGVRRGLTWGRPCGGRS